MLKVEVPVFAHQIYDYITKPALYNEEIFMDVGAHLSNLWTGLMRVSHALMWLVVYLLVVLIKLLTEVIPFFVDLVQRIADFHRTQLSYSDIVLECTFISIIALYFVFKKQIFALWRKVELWVRQKSARAAKILPHLLFFVISIIFSVAGRKFLQPLAAPSTLPLFTLLWPLATTVHALYKRSVSQYKITLVVWIIVASYHSACAFLTAMPFISTLRVPYSGEITVVVSTWIQLFPVCTEIVQSYIGPALNQVIDNLIPLAKVKESGQGLLKPVIYTLKLTGLINAAGEELIASLLQDGVSFVLCLIFLFTPRSIANLGVVIIGFVIPAYNTSLVSARSTSSQLQALKDGILSPKSSAKGRDKGKGKTMSDDADSELPDCVVCNALGRLCSQHNATPSPQKSGKSAPEEAAPFSILTPFRGLFSPKTPMTGKSRGPTKDEYSLVHEVRWLEYWVVFALVWYAKLSVSELLLWPSVLMVVTLYLQHSYFLGASKLIAFCKDLSVALVRRNQRMQKEQMEEEGQLLTTGSTSGDVARGGADERKSGNSEEALGLEDEDERMKSLANGAASTPTAPSNPSSSSASTLRDRNSSSSSSSSSNSSTGKVGSSSKKSKQRK